MSFDRNVISAKDVQAAIKAQRPPRDHEYAHLGDDGDDVVVVQPSADGWNQRLLKYIPGEALSLYIGLDSVIKSGTGNVVLWLTIALVISVVFNAIYLHQVWKVERVSQILISCFALIAYVFAMGGVFAATNPPWREPWQGTVVLIIATAFLAFVSPPETRQVPLKKSETVSS